MQMHRPRGRAATAFVATAMAAMAGAFAAGDSAPDTHAHPGSPGIVSPQQVHQIRDQTTVAFDVGKDGVTPSAVRRLVPGKRLNVVSDLELLNRYTDPATAAQPWLIQRLTERTYFIELAFHSVTAFVGDHGVLIIDAPNVIPPLPPSNASDGERLVQAIRTFTDKPVTRLIYTHPHQDHVGGAGYLDEALGDGFRIIGTKWMTAAIRRYGLPLPEPEIVIRDRVATYVFEDNPAFTFRIVTPEPAAHTTADSYVITPDRVLHVTDIIHPLRLPTAINGGVTSQEGWVRMLRYVAGERDNYDFINPGHENVAYFDDVQLTIDFFRSLYDKWWELTLHQPGAAEGAGANPQQVMPNGIMAFTAVEGVLQDNTVVWLRNYWDAMAERMLTGYGPIQGVLSRFPRFNKVPNVEAGRDHAAAVNDDVYLYRYSPTGTRNVPSFEPLPPPKSCADLALDDCG
jgi:glyoxylase-like metal-dependent hydrolase (beta-lactamase superfamily II)